MKKWVGIGCLGTLILICVASFVVMKNVRNLGALVIDRVAESAIEDLGLAEADAEVVRSSLEELTNAYKAGDIDSEELREFALALAEDPMLTIGAAIQAIRTQAIPESDLPETEKVAAIRTCERFIRGLSEGSITLADGEDIFDGFESDVRDVFEQELRADELREVIEALHRIAEKHRIPDEPFVVDFGTHMERQVDRVLGR